MGRDQLSRAAHKHVHGGLGRYPARGLAVEVPLARDVLVLYRGALVRGDGVEGEGGEGGLRGGREEGGARVLDDVAVGGEGGGREGAGGDGEGEVPDGDWEGRHCRWRRQRAGFSGSESLDSVRDGLRSVEIGRVGSRVEAGFIGGRRRVGLGVVFAMMRSAAGEELGFGANYWGLACVTAC